MKTLLYGIMCMAALTACSGTSDKDGVAVKESATGWNVCINGRI